MKPAPKKTFDPSEFLSHAGLGRRVVHFNATGAFFSQGSSADSICFLQKDEFVSLLYRVQAKRLRSLCLQRETSLGRNPLLECSDCEWRQQSQLVLL